MEVHVFVVNKRNHDTDQNKTKKPLSIQERVFSQQASKLGEVFTCGPDLTLNPAKKQTKQNSHWPIK